MIQEQTLLGSIILDASLMDKAIEAGVTADHFVEQDHWTLWTAFIQLRSTGKGLDLAAVAMQLGKDCPFTSYSNCERFAPTTLNFQTSLEHVLWSRKLYLLKARAKELSDVIASPEANPAEILGLATRINDICASSADSASADMTEATESVEKTFQEALDGVQDTRAKYVMPLPLFDRILGPVHDNEFVMIAARPSVGKTSFVTQWATELVRAGFNVAFIPTEVTAADIVRQLASQVACVNLQQLDRELPEKLRKAKDVAKKIRECKQLRIFDKSTDLSVIWSCCRMVKGWADVVIVDQLAQVRNPASSRYESITDTLSALVSIKKMLGKPVVVAHQLKRLAQGNPVPDLADLKDSGAAEQDASRVLLLHYPTENHNGVPQMGLNIDPPDTRDYYVIQAKHRFGVRDISVKCKYHAPTTRFLPA